MTLEEVLDTLATIQHPHTQRQVQEIREKMK